MDKEETALGLDPTLSIDRDSYEPAYMQLVNILRHQVASGAYRPGDRLPSESALRRQFDLSPMTVRRAINILSDQGVVVTSQGKGTFVKPLELGTATFDLQGLQELLRDDRTTVKMLDASIVSASERTARKLELPSGARVVFIRRLIVHDGEPRLYHREYLVYDPIRPLIEAELEITALRGLLDGAGGSGLKRGTLNIEASTLTGEEAQVLQGVEGSAALCLEHTFIDYQNRPVSWGVFIACGNCLRFTTTVGIQD